jgi:hypothetical protein
VLDGGVAATFQHVHEADQVAVDIGMRVLQRIAHAGLGCQVDHPVETLLQRTALHGRPVGNVDLHEAEVLVRLQARQPVALELHVVVVVQVVESDNGVAAGQQAQGRGAADETGCTGDKAPAPSFLGGGTNAAIQRVPLT